MSAPYGSYPWPPQHPGGYPPPAPKRRSPVDIACTVVIFGFAALAGVATLWFSLFFAMATDSCGEHCNTAPLGWAYVVTWGGVGTAALIAVVGTTVAAARRRIMWIWPTLALVLVVVSLGSGIVLADSVIHHAN